MIRSNRSCSSSLRSASRYVRPVTVRDSTGTPSAAARRSIASIDATPSLDWASSGESSGNCRGTRIRNTGTIVAFSALANRTVSSSARPRTSGPMNSSKIRRAASGRSRAGTRPRSASRYPPAIPPAATAITTATTTATLTTRRPTRRDVTRKPDAASDLRHVGEQVKPAHTREGVRGEQRGGYAIEPKALQAVDYKPADQTSRHTEDNHTPDPARCQETSQNLYTAARATSSPATRRRVSIAEQCRSLSRALHYCRSRTETRRSRMPISEPTQRRVTWRSCVADSSNQSGS